MSPAGTPPRSRPWLTPLVLILLSLPYCINLGVSSLWDANEAFYAVTPLEMMESGDYLAPRFNYQPRPQKPPLTYWAVLASYRMFGVTESAVRMPGALAAVGTIVLVFLMARRVASAEASLLAASVAATTVRVFILARRLPIDILLLFCLTAAAYFLWRATETGSRRDWALLYAFIGLGLLIKGPVALILPLATYLLWALWTRRFSWRAPQPVLGVSILALIVLPWYVAVFRAHGWAYISSFLLRDNWGRFASETFGPARSPLYYMPTFAADFFPWSVLAVFLIAGSLPQWPTIARRLAGSRFTLPAVWCVFTFVLFSFSKNKQEYYIAPIYPVAAVLLAVRLDRALVRAAESRARPARTCIWAFGTVALLLLAAGVSAFFFVRLALPGSPPVLHYLPVATLLLASLLLADGAVRGRIKRCFIALSIFQWGLLTLVAALYLPFVEAFRPVKPLCRTIDSEYQPGDEAGYYRATAPSMAFYLRRPIFEEFDADSMVRRLGSGKRVFCIMTESDYEDLVGKRDLVLHVLDRRPRLLTQLRDITDEDRWADRELLLVSNRAATDPEGRGNP